MSIPADAIILAREGQTLPAPQRRWQRTKDWAAGKIGRRCFYFPPLHLDPSICTAVLLCCEGNPGTIVVNGQPVAFEPLADGRFLLPTAPFVRWENTLALGAGARNVTLSPVLSGMSREVALDLPAAASWRLKSFDGHDLGVPLISSHEPAEIGGIGSLARTLLPFVVSDGDNAGDVWSFYDLQDHTFRLSAWRWDSAIVLEALVAAASHLHDDKFLVAARTVGERLLQVQLDTPDCAGGVPEWVDFRYSESNREVTEWVAPFNAGFIGAALARLGEATGDDRYLEGARRVLDCAVEKGLTEKGGVRGYYLPHSEQWQYLGQINDSGILPRGLAVLSGVNPELNYVPAALRSACYVIDKAACADGHFGRAWHNPEGAAPAGDPLFPEWRRYPDRLVPKIFLRGQAWVLFGLTASWRLTADAAIREKADRLVDYLIDVQQADGSWLYSQLQPQLGRCIKGTAAVALALAEYIRDTGNRKPFKAVQRALNFLDTVRSSSSGPDNLAAAPVDDSEEGCIIYFRNRLVVCAYAAALEVLTRIQMEELTQGKNCENCAYL